ARRCAASRCTRARSRPSGAGRSRAPSFAASSCRKSAPTAADPRVLAPLELLYEPDDLVAFSLPEEIASVYPGTLGFPEPRVFANFVSTLDGVVAIPSVPNSNKVVAGGSSSDRFVMGLLRACADTLVIGSGTLAAAPRSLWTPA